MKKSIFIFMLILFVSLCYADETLIFKRADDIDLKIPCFKSNNSLCSALAKCQLSVNYPNGSNLLNGGNMSYADTYFNYSLGALNTTGQYAAVMFCVDNSEAGYNNFAFIVNNSGSGNKPYGIAIILVALPFIIGLFLVIWGINLDGKNKWEIGDNDIPILEVNYGAYLKLFLFLAAYVSFWVMWFFIWQAADTFEVLPNLIDIISTIFGIWTFCFYPLILIIILMGLVKTVTDMKYLKMLKRGLKPR